MNRARLSSERVGGGILSFVSWVVSAVFFAFVVHGYQYKNWNETAIAFFFFVLGFILERLGV